MCVCGLLFDLASDHSCYQPSRPSPHHCCKLNATLRTCCLQWSSVVLTTSKSNSSAILFDIGILFSAIFIPVQTSRMDPSAAAAAAAARSRSDSTLWCRDLRKTDVGLSGVTYCGFTAVVHWYIFSTVCLDAAWGWSAWLRTRSETTSTLIYTVGFVVIIIIIIRYKFLSRHIKYVVTSWRCNITRQCAYWRQVMLSVFIARCACAISSVHLSVCLSRSDIVLKQLYIIFILYSLSYGSPIILVFPLLA